MHIKTAITRLRIARRLTQAEAATRAGLSRNTMYRLEKGDPGLAIGQVLRYLEAMAPGCTLLDLLQENDPSLAALAVSEQRRRVRKLSKEELDKLDFQENIHGREEGTDRIRLAGR